MVWRRGVVTMVVVVVVVVLAPKWNDKGKMSKGICSVSKPHGKNEREGTQGRGDIQTMDSTYPTNANTSVESVQDPRLVGSEGTWA